MNVHAARERDAHRAALHVDAGEVLRPEDLELIAPRVDEARGKEVDARAVGKRALANDARERLHEPERDPEDQRA